MRDCDIWSLGEKLEGSKRVGLPAIPAPQQLTTTPLGLLLAARACPALPHLGFRGISTAFAVLNFTGQLDQPYEVQCPCPVPARCPQLPSGRCWTNGSPGRGRTDRPRLAVSPALCWAGFTSGQAHACSCITTGPYFTSSYKGRRGYQLWFPNN